MSKIELVAFSYIKILGPLFRETVTSQQINHFIAVNKLSKEKTNNHTKPTEPSNLSIGPLWDQSTNRSACGDKRFSANGLTSVKIEILVLFHFSCAFTKASALGLAKLYS